MSGEQRQVVSYDGWAGDSDGSGSASRWRRNGADWKEPGWSRLGDGAAGSGHGRCACPHAVQMVERESIDADPLPGEPGR